MFAQQDLDYLNELCHVLVDSDDRAARLSALVKVDTMLSNIRPVGNGYEDFYIVWRDGKFVVNPKMVV